MSSYERRYLLFAGDKTKVNAQLKVLKKWQIIFFPFHILKITNEVGHKKISDHLPKLKSV